MAVPASLLYRRLQKGLLLSPVRDVAVQARLLGRGGVHAGRPGLAREPLVASHAEIAALSLQQAGLVGEVGGVAGKTLSLRNHGVRVGRGHEQLNALVTG
jgi:hypothetical protein